MSTHYPYKKPLSVNSKNHTFSIEEFLKYEYFPFEKHFWDKKPLESCNLINGWFRKFAILLRHSPYKRTISIDDYQEKKLTNDRYDCHAFAYVSVDRCEGFFRGGTMIEVMDASSIPLSIQLDSFYFFFFLIFLDIFIFYLLNLKKKSNETAIDARSLLSLIKMVIYLQPNAFCDRIKN